MNFELARQILDSAYRQGFSDEYSERSRYYADVKSILMGNHVTFRYILLTAVLAKCVDPKIHTRSLQASSNLPGSYDARSLCHKVVVPFESSNFNGSLGGSNEPFLNKPARFPSIETSNAVRKGSDKQLLLRLYKILEDINSEDSKVVFDVLCDCMLCVKDRGSRVSGISISEGGSGGKIWNIRRFGHLYINKSFEGQTAATAAGALFDISTSLLSGCYSVTVHPINQSGASSREISDIDVMLNGRFRYAVEVKDKSFQLHDVRHAVGKVKNFGHDSLIFICGPRSVVHADDKARWQAMLSDDTFTLSFLNLVDFLDVVVALVPAELLQSLPRLIQFYCSRARVKDAVVDHLKECALEFNIDLGR
jgi:hypothetical protein